MATSGAATSMLTGGSNRGSSIKVIGTNPNSTVPANVQQAGSVVQNVKNQSKGTNLDITIENNGGAAELFLLFDTMGLAATTYSLANGADIEYSTNFAGGGGFTAPASGFYSLLLNHIKQGSRAGSVGTMFTFSSSANIPSTGLTMYNGNTENYNKQNIQPYLTLAKDTYANDQATRILNTTIYVNPFLAITGSIPASGNLDILFNLVLHSNW